MGNEIPTNSARISSMPVVSVSKAITLAFASSLTKFFSLSSVSTITNSNIEVVIVDTEDKLKNLVKELAKAKVIAFDTETTGIEEMRAELVGISLPILDRQ